MRTQFVLTHVLNRFFFPAALLAIASNTSLYADVYKQVDENGNVSYSDVPHKKGDKPISVPEPMTYKPLNAPKSSTSDQSKKPATPEPVSYGSVTITAPANDATIRSNNGDIVVQINSTPALQGGHTYVLFLDGNKMQQSSTGSFKLTNVDRGSHTISVQIQDDQAQILASAEPVTIHLFRHSIIHKK